MEFREIPGWPGYRVSDFGQVESSRVRGTGRLRAEWRPLKTKKSIHGYLRVSLRKDRRSRRVAVHHLVLVAFVGPRPPGMECRHLDGNRTNNWTGNLCWGTRKENHDDQKRHGTALKGSRCFKAVLVESQIPEIDRMRSEGKLISEIADLLGVSKHVIQRVGVRETWKHIPKAQYGVYH